MNVNIGGTWTRPREIWVNIGGTWRRAAELFVKIGNDWRRSTDLGANILGNIIVAASVITRSVSGGGDFTRINYDTPREGQPGLTIPSGSDIRHASLYASDQGRGSVNYIGTLRFHTREAWDEAVGLLSGKTPEVRFQVIGPNGTFDINGSNATHTTTFTNDNFSISFRPISRTSTVNGQIWDAMDQARGSSNLTLRLIER